MKNSTVSVLTALLASGLACATGAPVQVDRFGQYIGENWPGKITSDQQLREEAAAEEVQLIRFDAFDPQRFDRYGGILDGQKFRATGFFRLEKVRERWWFITPEGNRFFLIGCDAPDFYEKGYATPLTQPDGTPRNVFLQLPEVPRNNTPFSAYSRPGMVNFLAANLQLKYGEDFREKALEINRRRLISWGFNSTPKWGWGTHIGLPFIEDMNFRKLSRFRNYLRNIDVYAPDFRENAEKEIVQQIARRRHEPLLLGYSTENESGLSFSMLDGIAAGKNSPMKRALIDFLWEELGEENVGKLFKVTGKFDRSSVARTPRPGIRIPRRQAAAFIRKTSQLYHRQLREIYRKHDPDHLWFGAGHCKHQAFEWIYEAIPYVDALLLHDYDIYAAWSTPIRKRLHELDQPYIIAEYSFVQARRGYPAFNGYVCVPDEKSRGTGYRYFTEQLAADPNCVGFGYFILYDQAVTRRSLPRGEAYNFGLVNQQDQSYHAMLEQVRIANEELPEIHAGRRQPFAANPADILGWKSTRLSRLQVLPGSRSPYIIGDAVMADEFYGGCPFRFKVNDAIATEFLQGRKHIFVSIGTIKADSYFADARATVHLWKKRRGSDLNRFFRLEYSFDNRQFTPLKMRFTLEQEMEHDRYSMTPAEPMPENCRYLRLSIGVTEPERAWMAAIADWRVIEKNKPLQISCISRKQSAATPR